MIPRMQCHVYASTHKDATYLWLDDPKRLDTLPHALRQLLGEVRFVLELELERNRALPQQDAGTILENLRSQGWHLQLPPGSAGA